MKLEGVSFFIPIMNLHGIVATFFFLRNLHCGYLGCVCVPFSYQARPFDSLNRAQKWQTAQKMLQLVFYIYNSKSISIDLLRSSKLRRHGNRT